MGSGGMIVMDEDDCIVDVARFYLGFTVEESCGKCAPCRVGGRKLYNLLGKISAGKASLEDIDRIRAIGLAMQRGSLCGLGQTAPNPVLSTLTHFRDEYLSHIEANQCPAGVCKDLVTYWILEDACTGCTVCARKCPVSCISGEKRSLHTIDQDACIKCGICYESCKFSAIERR